MEAIAKRLDDGFVYGKYLNSNTLLNFVSKQAEYSPKTEEMLISLL